ncbi:hypothetical protein NX722_17340 [Endozoicomonas gorgoniicola]|uniref:Uncharacterized protein n=1 Tax=Endozoicomonas gorgoniicola TaxID=1234144 RepID=A0ABT3MY94_9GAMM|nr:hypothetical protein [Endozoicomonas gorgoniicola]MCW7554352.1 hypothetical protein [Endozoicomonas gorgoniicola]
MYHEFKIRYSTVIRHLSPLALSMTLLVNSVPGKAAPTGANATIAPNPINATTVPTAINATTPATTSAYGAVDCTLDIKTGGSSVGYGRCPLASRCSGSEAKNDCIPEFGAKYGGQFVPAIRQWGTSDIGGLKNPVDVAENPKKRGQIWAVNSGGDSLSIFYCPRTKTGYKPEERSDLASCHFMHHPTAIDFGEAPADGDKPDFPGTMAEYLSKSGTFITTPGGCNDYTAINFMRPDYTKRRCTDFMGPTLWENNLKTFAIKNNDFFPDNLKMKPFGSHLSMIHQQPYAMGVVWDGKDAGYWTWDAGVDSKYGSIVYTNITQSHGYGGYTHTGASLFRYAGTTMTKKSAAGPIIPGHMVKYDKFLFIANPAKGVINVLDTGSGSSGGHVKPKREWREYYTTYTSMVGATFTELKVKGLKLETPSGLAISEDRLFVTDAATGYIHAIRLNLKTQNHTLIGSIYTPSSRIAGLTIDKQTKRIWFVDSIEHTLSVVEPPCSNIAQCDYSGDSPWSDDCAPDMDEKGKPVWDAHIEKAKNHSNWKGCARYYYLACPGGNVHKNSKLEVCYRKGGNWKNADVEWSEGESTCHCPTTSGANQVAASVMLPAVLIPALTGLVFW